MPDTSVRQAGEYMLNNSTNVEPCTAVCHADPNQRSGSASATAVVPTREKLKYITLQMRLINMEK